MEPDLDFVLYTQATFTVSIHGLAPSIDAATRFVFHCQALVAVDREAGRSPDEDANGPPDGKCWHCFFYLVWKTLATHPDQAIACELSILLVGKLVYIGQDMAAAAQSGPSALEHICERFAVKQLDLLAERTCEEPVWLAYSVFGSASKTHDACITIYKPTEHGPSCVLYVARRIGQSLREHNIKANPLSISNALEKVLAVCALWKGLPVGRVFVRSFIKRFLLSSSTDFANSPGSATSSMDRQLATDFMRLVHHCALPQQRLAEEDKRLPGLAPELTENGEIVAVEHVLDNLLKACDETHGIGGRTLEAIIVRRLPALLDPCLTQQEYSRLLYRREIHPDSVIHGAKPFNLTTLAGAPPYCLHPPACPLTPAEVIAYLPNALCIPEIWKWISGHGWTPLNIPKFLNKARELNSVWKVDCGTFRNWQRAANALFRENRDLDPPPHTPMLDISPYVLVLSVQRHPVGDEAGYFTKFARHAAISGDLNGKQTSFMIDAEMESASNDSSAIQGSWTYQDNAGMQGRVPDSVVNNGHYAG
ncbi:hypothetical protein B0J12DRAFT_785044 [Macrophomina phaseolina]|uniref:Uncharacterized protein n=1 Tax=Macrophomina phaseolina TaxID=35725 RepID=A0ABQ8GF99_9PEZI|nr:hypothetical protein B0J12DRAFT_785044 [Macrophomina phaseolina]